MSVKSLTGFDAGGKRVTGVATPTATDDATTKAYVDGVDATLATKKLGGSETVAVAATLSTSITLDVSLASVFTLTTSAFNYTSLTITNVPASGTACTITLIVTQGGTARTIATPSGGIFLGAASPTQVASKICVFTYMTVDGGTTWICSAAVQV